MPCLREIVEKMVMPRPQQTRIHLDPMPYSCVFPGGFRWTVDFISLA